MLQAMSQEGCDGSTQLGMLLGDLTSEEFSQVVTCRLPAFDGGTTVDEDREIPVLRAFDRRLQYGEILGQGGEGVVQLAVQRSLDRPVAVKRLRPDVSHMMGEVNLLREAWIGGLLAHPNIVAVHDLDRDEAGKPAIVCQHVDGEPWTRSLNADIAESRLPSPRVLEHHLRILLRVCDAVAFAHDRGFLHRDLKPDNVMLGKFGEVYLIDWGIAVALDKRHGKRFPVVTDILSASGTPIYMAPELIRDQDDDELFVGIPTDIYLLGGILYRIIAGRPPHKKGSLDDMLESIRTSTFAFPSHAPAELVEICRRSLAREPRRRFQSVQLLSAALRDFLAKQQARVVLVDADEKLRQLRALVRSEAEESTARFDLYRLFSACRFGYGTVRDVLAAEARRGMAAAAEIMVAYELDRGDPDSAETVLGEVEDVSDVVLERIAQARKYRDDQLANLKSYAAVGRSHDARIGVRTRFVIGLLGFLIMIAGPLIRLIAYLRFDITIGAVQQVVSAAVTVAVFATMLWGSRRYLRRHAVTRAAVVIILAIGVVHTLLGVTMLFANIEIGFVRIMNCYVIGMGCFIFGWFFERSILWSAVAFFSVGVAITMSRTDVVGRNLLFMGAGTFFLVNALLVWGPLRKTSEQPPLQTDL